MIHPSAEPQTEAEKVVVGFLHAWGLGAWPGNVVLTERIDCIHFADCNADSPHQGAVPPPALRNAT